MKEAEGVQLVVCDMAGTTVRDEHEVELCFTKAALETGLLMTDAEILSVQGWAKKHVFEVFWERQRGRRDDGWKQSVESSYKLFKQVLEEHYTVNPVYPTLGCQELFMFLKQQHIPVALTTGFYRKVTNIILGKLGWLQGLDAKYTGNGYTVIQASVSSDEVINGRPEPDMIYRCMELLGIRDAGSVISIGDTPSDILSGKKAGCRFSCCVTNGTHSAAQLEDSRPDKTFGSLAEFGRWLKENT